MWWQSGGTAGGYHGIIKELCDSFAIINDVKLEKRTGKLRYYFTEIAIDYKGTATSTIFKRKYSPITEQFVKDAQAMAGRINKKMNIITKTGKDFPDDNIYPRYNDFTDNKNAG